MAEDVEPTDQRRVIIGAIALAAIVAAALWYFVVIRPTAEEPTVEDAGLAPGESPIAAVHSPAAELPSAAAAASTSAAPAVAPATTESAGTPGPTSTAVPAMPSAPTGVGEWVLAGALAATLGGLVGLRRPRA